LVKTEQQLVSDERWHEIVSGGHNYDKSLLDDESLHYERK
jgi:hypothetical protein